MPLHVDEKTIPRISQLGGGHWTFRGLKTITVILGKNGSGKSVMMRAWRDQDSALGGARAVGGEDTSVIYLQRAEHEYAETIIG